MFRTHLTYCTLTNQKNQPDETGGPDKPSERSQYDELMHDNILDIILPASGSLLELDIIDPQPFVTDLVSYTKREADYIGKFTESDGDKAFLHLELQTKDDPNMVHRMRQYQYMVEARFELPVYQYCIYLGQKPSKMATELRQRIPKATNNYQYKLIELRNYPFRYFVESDTPEMVVLAILGNPGNTPAEEMIESAASQSPNIPAEIAACSNS